MSGSLELIVGQDIKIRAKIKPADIGGAKVQSSEWSVPGTVAQEWEADNDSAELDELEADERKQPGNGTDPGPEHPVQFYWYKGTDAGQDHEVKCEFTLDKGGPLKGVVKYEVVKPEITAQAFCLPEWRFDLKTSRVVYDSAVPPSAGFQSTGTVNYQEAEGGNIQWVQTLKTEIGFRTGEDEAISPENRGKWGVNDWTDPTRLDQNFPAKAEAANALALNFWDSPKRPLILFENPNVVACGDRTEYETFLMYKPEKPGAHWVPQLHYVWKVKMTANYSDGGQVRTAQLDINSGATGGDFISSTQYPKWDGLGGDTATPPQQIIYNANAWP